MKDLTILAMFLSILLGACATPAPSAEAIQTAIALTQSANPIPTFGLQPAATSTPILLAGLNLEGVLLWPGDLPKGYAASQAHPEPSAFMNDAPIPDYSISRMISRAGQPGGRIDVLVYADSEKVATAYELAVSQFIGEPVKVQVGEQGKVALTISPTQTAALTFTRCHAIVAMQLLGTSTADGVLSYAKRLDYRLTPLVCR
jgi:ABC-type Fe3+-hydroxamate transport system substrate-binding protein